MLPDFVEIIEAIERTSGRIRFPRRTVELIERLKIGNYPQLYLNEQSLSRVFMLALMPPEEVPVMCERLGAASLDERARLLAELGDCLDELHPIFETHAAPNDAVEPPSFKGFSDEDIASAQRLVQLCWMGLLANFFQSLAMVVVGRKLTDLVAEAMAGDDSAFCKAVQLDSTILLELPYFKTRHSRANLEGDTEFLQAVAHHMSLPPYNGVIRYKPLWLTFFFLDRVGLLGTLRHADLLSLCVDVGATKGMTDVFDVGYLSKRLATYRRYQKMRLKSRHSP